MKEDYIPNTSTITIRYYTSSNTEFTRFPVAFRVINLGSFVTTKCWSARLDRRAGADGRDGETAGTIINGASPALGS